MRNLMLFLAIALFLSGKTSLFSQKPFDYTVSESKKKLVLHILGHSGVFVEYDTLKIYVDPNSNFCDFTTMPKADLILVTHEHADHFDINAINAIHRPKTLVVYTHLCSAKKLYKGDYKIMANGDSLKIDGIGIKAVPAYDIDKIKHLKGFCNGYVVKLGKKRIYFSGDTELIPEMADLENIDVAFLPLSQPNDMTPKTMEEAAHIIKPKILIPYHYDDHDPSKFLKLMEKHHKIKVLTGAEEQ